MAQSRFNSVQRRWVLALAFVVASAAVIGFLLLSHNLHSGVMIALLGRTNDLNGHSYSFLHISNGTDSVYAFKAWNMFPTNASWTRDSLTNLTIVDLNPRATHTFTVETVTNRKQRVVILCSRYTNGELDYWLSFLRKMQKRPDLYKVNVDLN